MADDIDAQRKWVQNRLFEAMEPLAGHYDAATLAKAAEPIVTIALADAWDDGFQTKEALTNYVETDGFDSANPYRPGLADVCEETCDYYGGKCVTCGRISPSVHPSVARDFHEAAGMQITSDRSRHAKGNGYWIPEWGYYRYAADPARFRPNGDAS